MTGDSCDQQRPPFMKLTIDFLGTFTRKAQSRSTSFSFLVVIKCSLLLLSVVHGNTARANCV